MKKSYLQILAAFTLPELVLYLTILLILLVSVFTLSLDTLSFQNQSSAEAKLLQNGKLIMSELEKQINSAGSIDNNLSRFDIDPSTLALIPTNPTPSTTPIRFISSNKQLFLIIAENQPIALTEINVSLEKLIFALRNSPPSPPLIKVEFDLKYQGKIFNFKNAFGIRLW